MSLGITIHDRPLGVDLRELYLNLESKQDFSTWAKARLAQFIEGEDFSSLHKSVEREIGATRRIDYAVSIDCAKHIAMMEQTEKGREVRAYFIECEKKLSAPPVAIPTHSEALRLAADAIDKANALALEVADMKPKAEFHDTVTASDDVTQLGVACQVLGLPFGRNTLFQRLRNMGVLISSGERHNLPKQRFIEQGLFTVKESSYLDDERQVHVRFTTYVTQKGMAWLGKQFSARAERVTA
jgi:anti-repressor protein